MRMALVLAAMIAAAGCDEPKRAASDKVVENVANAGVMWPVMLAHCLRAPACDPTTDFGQGKGEASNAVDQATYFVQAKDVVKEGGEDYGAAITVSLHGNQGTGGKGGRPLTPEEMPDSLYGANARRSTLSIEYRTPGGGAPEPYGLTFTSMWLAIPDNNAEGLLEITGKAGVLLSANPATMEPKGKPSVAAKAGLQPVVFYYPHNLRDEKLPALMAAIAAGETLGLRITIPGGVTLQDAIYTGGYAEALREGTEALADPELARTIPERCARFAKERDEFWKIADVTGALHVCDPRTVQQRLQP